MRSSAAARSGAVAASIGCTGRPTSSRTLRSPSAPVAERDPASSPGSPSSISARRTSASGTRRRPRDGVGHHGLQRALAQVAQHQPAQELLLAAGRPAEQLGQLAPPLGLRPGAGHPGQALEGGVDVGHRERGLRRRRRRLAQRRPAHAQPPLPRLTGQEGDAGRRLVRPQPRDAAASSLDLGGARARVAATAAEVDDLVEQHPVRTIRSPGRSASPPGSRAEYIFHRWQAWCRNWVPRRWPPGGGGGVRIALQLLALGVITGFLVYAVGDSWREAEDAVRSADPRPTWGWPCWRSPPITWRS